MREPNIDNKIVKTCHSQQVFGSQRKLYKNLQVSMWLVVRAALWIKKGRKELLLAQQDKVCSGKRDGLLLRNMGKWGKRDRQLSKGHNNLLHSLIHSKRILNMPICPFTRVQYIWVQTFYFCAYTKNLKRKVATWKKNFKGRRKQTTKEEKIQDST